MSGGIDEPDLDDDAVVPTGKTSRDEPKDEPDFDDDVVTPTGKTRRDEPDDEPGPNSA